MLIFFLLSLSLPLFLVGAIPHSQLVCVQVVVPSRGRGGAWPGAGQMGRGRSMPTRQSQRVAAESQPCTVSIEGLSSSTTDIQLKNLLSSIGPIEVGPLLTLYLLDLLQSPNSPLLGINVPTLAHQTSDSNEIPYYDHIAPPVL